MSNPSLDPLTAAPLLVAPPGRLPVPDPNNLPLAQSDGNARDSVAEEGVNSSESDGSRSDAAARRIEVRFPIVNFHESLTVCAQVSTDSLTLREVSLLERLEALTLTAEHVTSANEVRFHDEWISQSVSNTTLRLIAADRVIVLLPSAAPVVCLPSRTHASCTGSSPPQKPPTC